MHPTRDENPRTLRRSYRVAARLRRVPELEQQARCYRLERQAQAAADLARMVARYSTHMED